MSAIRIIETPAGEAPEAVRRQWIGVTVPLPVWHPATPVDLLAGGVLSRPTAKSRLAQIWARATGRITRWRGFALDGGTCVAALERRSPDAATWWRAHAAHVVSPGRSLVFPASACKAVHDVGVEEEAANPAFTKERMMEFFSDRAKATMADARSEALRLRHGEVAPEHVLLGVLSQRTCIARAALARSGIQYGQLRTDLLAKTAAGDRRGKLPKVLPFTSGTKMALEHSLNAARYLRDCRIGTEHLLLGLMLAGNSNAATAMGQRGVTVEGLRDSIIEALAAAYRSR